MRRAIMLARKGLGRTAPNPAVGAVVVRQGNIVGEGFHKKAGTPHAEVHALDMAGEAARGGTIYVTLEPCNHTGRTPPCTQAILKAGITEVVIGAMDPNPRVEGGGAEFLRSQGIKVRTGCLEEESRQIIAPFAKHLITGLPWVRAKAASSLDGKIATSTGNSKWITNERARIFGHGLRDVSDAILVGKKTVVADDPRLTCRLKKKETRDPARIILDSELSTSLNSRLFHLDSSAPTIFIGVEGRCSGSRIREFKDAGADVWLTRPGQDGRVDLPEALKRIGDFGIQSLLVEGGAEVHGSFFDHNLVDELFFFFAPIIIGGSKSPSPIGGRGATLIKNAPRLNSHKMKRFGDNWLVHGILTDLDDLWRMGRCSQG